MCDSFKSFFITLIINNKSDSKRQQTTTVNYKRLFNGLVLTDGFSLLWENKQIKLWPIKNLKGFKHVIETSGIQHSENRHGEQSKDREPLSLEDYLLVPFIIRNRDKVSISTSKSKRHDMGIVVYEKLIGSNYYYVEEIRTGKKSLAFQTLYKRATKNPSDEGL